MKSKMITRIAVLALILGICILLYPSVMDAWNSKVQSKAIVDYEETVQRLPAKDSKEEFRKADEYNRKLCSLAEPFVDYMQIDNAQQIFNVNKNGMIGYIEIEKINVKLPIYYGASIEVLNIAAGLLEGSSFPTGKADTHSVLLAHRGRPDVKMFTELDKMEIGDSFEVHVLDKVFVYQVDKILIVEPNDVKSLKIIEGENHCSLVTCTPYGINTHRLIVRGTDIEGAGHKSINVVNSNAHLVETYIVTGIGVVVMLLMILCGILLKSSIIKGWSELIRRKENEE